MAKLSKRQQAIREKVGRAREFSAEDAFSLLRDVSTVRFAESVDVSVNLGVDPRKSDQVVRGSTVLPHGTGKTVRVAVFAQGASAESAKEAGADVIGMEDLAARIQGGELDFGVVIAAPDAMGVVGRLGRILGPRGLMPNPRVGTVTSDLATAVRNAKAGQVRYRTDRGGLIHCTLGKVGFEVAQLQQNLDALIADLLKIKPAAAKGVYLKKVTVSTTMGPGLQVELSSLRA